MWNVQGNNLTMAEGDWGIALRTNLTGMTFTENDQVKLVIKTAVNAEPPLIEKTYSDITGNAIDIELTQAESALLPVGSYVYRLDWFQNGVFMCNLIDKAKLKVVDKA